jgi:LAO/AO transport system kinase
MHELTQRILQGDRRAIARAISYIENDDPSRLQVLQDLFPHTGKAFLLGITGAPGAGKSSFVDCFIGYLRRLGLTVGVIAVDPTSPFTGGAILGDRVRMQGHSLDEGVFIRSMGTRGSLGGLARSSKEAVRILDAAGFDVILIETVGVGQSELDIMNVADSVAVLLNPGGGDTIQAFKAGIMEIADLFILNKADLPGIQKLAREVEQMLDLAKHDAPWRPPVVQTISLQNVGIDEVWHAFTSHRTFLQEQGQWEMKRAGRLKDEVIELVDFHLHQLLLQKLKTKSFGQLLDDVENRRKDPYEAARQMIEEWLKTT